MRKRTKVWLIIAAFLVLLGCILFAGVMETLGWDFRKLSTTQYETNTYEIREGFNSISMNTDTADIVFALSDNGTCKVECHEEEKAKHSVKVEEGVLNIKLIDERAGYFRINIGSPKITVYLPETEYASLFIDESTGDIVIPKEFRFNHVDLSLSTGFVHFNASASARITIKVSTGEIRMENLSAGALDLSVSTGKTYLTDLACNNLTSSGDTGDLYMENVIVAETLSIRRSTGDIKFDQCDAAEIFAETDTGDVRGNLRSNKVFMIETDTGNVDVPKTVDGGKCEITTDTGDIKIKILS